MVGTLGSIEFSVSEDMIRTFRDLSFTHSASYAEHKIIGRKGLLEFTGLNASTCSMKIFLDAQFGVNPAEELQTLYEAMNAHEAIAFTLGGQVMGGGLWVIETLNETHSIIGAGGALLRAEVSVSLKEYVE
ncbi:MAG: phage tail protein [Synergistaceae bacterium]|nr:phage tail protein [Synergistaceae bacterium]